LSPDRPSGSIKNAKKTHRGCHLPLSSPLSCSQILIEVTRFSSHHINPVSDREIPHNEKPLFGGTLSTAASTATEAKTDSLPTVRLFIVLLKFAAKNKIQTWWLSHPSLLANWVLF
jgi:hypothetical protein